MSRFSPRTIWITTFGLGHLRPAPGTWGSLPPCVAAAALAHFHAIPGTELSWLWYVVMGVLLYTFSMACIFQGHAAEAEFGRKDPSQAVADETAGMALVLLTMPDGACATFWGMVIWVGAAFVLFRIMDIIKPPPARGLQRLKSGWGILIDDLLAAGYAIGVLWLVWVLAGHWGWRA